MFYQGLDIVYAVLLCAALWCNRACWRGFLLSVVVGASIFAPVPWTTPTYIWYLQLLVVELASLTIVVCLNFSASYPVALFFVMKSALHLLGAVYGPVAGIGPYRITQPLLDISQLVLCVVMSPAVRQRFELRAKFKRGQV